MHYLVQQQFQHHFEVGNVTKQIQDLQYDVLQNLVSNVYKPNLITLEIGSWTGLSAILIGNVVQRTRGTHYCVDWFKGNDNIIGSEAINKIVEKVDVSKIFKRNIEFFNLSDTIKLYKMTSKEASKKIPKDIKFDFIFIDGNHNYPYVLEDFKLWFPKLKRGGILCGHDYETSKDSVDIISSFKQRQNEGCYTPNDILVKNDIWYLIKNPPFLPGTVTYDEDYYGPCEKIKEDV